MSAFDGFFFIVSLILLVISILGIIYSKETIYLATGITYSDLIKEGVSWSLKQFKIPPDYKTVRIVASWKKKNFTNVVGFFRHADRTIHIYCHHPHLKTSNDGINLKNLSNTILEEAIHSIQITSNKEDQRYTLLLKQLGYDKHPIEIEAKKYAAKFTESLAEYLEKRKLVIKK